MPRKPKEQLRADRDARLDRNFAVTHERQAIYMAMRIGDPLFWASLTEQQQRLAWILLNYNPDHVDQKVDKMYDSDPRRVGSGKALAIIEDRQPLSLWLAFHGISYPQWCDTRGRASQYCLSPSVYSATCVQRAHDLLRQPDLQPPHPCQEAETA